MDTIPSELTALPYQIFPLQRADASDVVGPEYVTGYLVLPDGEVFVSRWLEVQLARFRAALPAGWSAGWLATDPGDTRIVVRRSAVTIAQPDPAPPGETMTIGTGDAKDMPPGLAEELAGMPDAERRVAERVAALPEIKPTPGYEERALERAKREGVLR